MIEGEQEEQGHYHRQSQQLMLKQKTLLLSTVSMNAEPESSYAPYVRDEKGVFYIYVSDLALHTQNMLQTAKASILFIQAEEQAKNLFARERLVFDCKVKEIMPSEKRYDEHLLAMKDKFGETVDLLRSLNDFHLLALTAVNGKYVAGFGRAFKVDTANEVT